MLTLAWAALALCAAWQVAALVYDIVTFVPFVKPAKRKRGLGKERWSPEKLGAAPFDAVIVGSGMAGLSTTSECRTRNLLLPRAQQPADQEIVTSNLAAGCASLLSCFGYRVLVLEQHEVVGGGAHCYAVDGKAKWKFDSGLHYTIPQAGGLLALACGARSYPVRVSRMGEQYAEGDVYDRVLLAGAGQEELRIANEVQMVGELKARFIAYAHQAICCAMTARFICDDAMLKARFPSLSGALDRFVKVSAGLLAIFPLWCLTSLLPHTYSPPVILHNLTYPGASPACCRTACAGSCCARRSSASGARGRGARPPTGSKLSSPARARMRRCSSRTSQACRSHNLT